MPVKLIADSGSTKTDWCLIDENRKKRFSSQGMSPYFINGEQIEQILITEVTPFLKKIKVDEIFFYGTGCSNPENARVVKNAIKKVFPQTEIKVDHDLMAAAKALCGDEKGIACILGTGCNSCYYNGKRIVKNSPGLGYILGDEGSGAYLGKKVLQHYLYKIFDNDLKQRFDAKFATTDVEILNAIYKQPLANRYMASYAIFLAENRGHYMIENILEDGINDFFVNHINNYKESASMPVNFVGSIAFGFKDVLQIICNANQIKPGKILKNSIEGLIAYHNK